MPASLRFVLGMLVLAALATPVAIFGVYREDQHQAKVVAEQLTGGSVDAGKDAITRLQCGSCHQIGGIGGATGMVGPALDGVGARAFIAGKLSNSPDNMVRWLRRPQAVVPGNGMPDQGVTDREARDMAAYLYTLKK